MTTIRGFQGQYRWLSNFWYAPIQLEGFVFSTNEHAYQAAKMKNRSDIHKIIACDSPGQAKRMGRLLPIRAEWDHKKLETMYRINEAKYMQHDDLRQKLLATGDCEIIEQNTWGDIYWGQCNGRGTNHLGKILMEIREKLA